MLIYIIHNDNICTFRLPKEVSGNYMLTDIDSDGKTRSLINISSENGHWYFNSNYDVKLVGNGAYISTSEVVPYHFYLLHYFEKEYITIYVIPGYETNSIIKNVNTNCTLSLGNDSSCDIVYNNSNIAQKQLELIFENGIWKLNNLNKNITIYVNKKKFFDGLLSNFDQIFLVGLRIIILNNRLVFLFPPQTLGFNNEKLLSDTFEIVTENKSSKEIAKEFYNSDDYFYKSPIFKKKYDEYEVVITEPERKSEKPDSNLFFSIVPSALMSLTSLISLYFTLTRRSEGDTETFVTNIVMCAVFLVTGIVWPIIENAAEKFKFHLTSKRRVKNYKKYLTRKENEIKEVIEKEKSVLSFNNISLQECEEAIQTKNSNLFSRSIGSTYFLQVKCGTGKVKSSIKFSYNRPDMIVNNDKLYDDIDTLINKYEYIEDANFVVSLKETSLAVVNYNNNNNAQNFMDALILQLVCLHDYDNLKLVVLTKDGSNLNIVKNLNHCWNNDRTFRYYATNLQEAENVSAELMKSIDRKLKSKEEGESSKNDTYYVIVSDCIEKYKSLKLIEYAFRQSDKKDQNKNLSVIMFTNKVTNIPTGCNYFINYDDENSTYFNSEMEEKKIISFKPSCIDNTINYFKCIELLSNIPIKFNSSDVGAGNNLPTKLGFLEMFGVGKIDQLNIYERWKSAPISSTLQTQVGVDTSGNTLYLDLHEKKHGPHGLIAGMTGSGKSEFIVTYILSLAINYSPNEVQFVLIDYKGGGLAGAFENRKTGMKLPHLVGTITNLDKAEMNRTLVSIKSELQRRQKVFNGAKEKLNIGSMDIYKYQMFVRDGALDEPMSHLFIICDEFAELKAQQPDFMDELVSAARIGRSLGVHLILATQKPSGVVDEQIWSNAKFKVCCKVQSTDDSNEMLKKPDAAYIKESGRFYLQVGYDEYYVLAQSGYSGVQYVPTEVVATNTDNTIMFINNNGDAYRNTLYKHNEERESLGEELSIIFNYIIKVAKEHGFTNKQLWLDNIPKKLYLGTIFNKYKNISSKAYNINPIIGEFDDPENQNQGVARLQITGAGNTIILGNASSGKSNLLFTLLFSTMINHTSEEVNIYILDMGSEKFNIFKNAPHVGDILTLNDKNKMTYFFYMIESELNRRQKYYSENGGDFLLDAQNGKTPFPNIIIIMYGLEVFRETFDDIYDSLLLSIIRMCSKMGIEFVMTGMSFSSLGLSLDTSVNQKVLLQLADESDYSYIFKDGHAPSKNPGRGVMLINERALEFQTALICDELQQKSYLEEVFKQLKTVMKNEAKRVPEIPKKLSLSEYKNYAKDLSNVVIGINMITAQQEKFDFSKRVTLLSASSASNTYKFFEKIVSLLTIVPNTNIIVINGEKDLNLNLSDKVKYYDSGFSDIVKVLYTNCEKINENPSDKKFIVMMLGYSGINSHLKKAKADDDSIKTLEDLIKVCNNDAFKFFLFDSEGSFRKMLNTDISNYIDNSNGIWIGPDFDGNSAFDIQGPTEYNSINITNDMIVLVKNSDYSIVKYPTL